MNDSPNDPRPIAEAMQWVAILTTIALEMVLPGIAGRWLDGRFGTQYLVLVGLAVGLAVGLWHLVQVTKTKSKPDSKNHSP